jgi:hypothetical protein
MSSGFWLVAAPVLSTQRLRFALFVPIALEPSFITSAPGADVHLNCAGAAVGTAKPLDRLHTARGVVSPVTVTRWLHSRCWRASKKWIARAHFSHRACTSPFPSRKCKHDPSGRKRTKGHLVAVCVRGCNRITRYAVLCVRRLRASSAITRSYWSLRQNLIACMRGTFEVLLEAGNARLWVG